MCSFRSSFQREYSLVPRDYLGAMSKVLPVEDKALSQVRLIAYLSSYMYHVSRQLGYPSRVWKHNSFKVVSIEVN